VGADLIVIASQPFSDGVGALSIVRTGLHRAGVPIIWATHKFALALTFCTDVSIGAFIVVVTGGVVGQRGELKRVNGGLAPEAGLVIFQIVILVAGSCNGTGACVGRVGACGIPIAEIFGAMEVIAAAVRDSVTISV